LPLDQRVKGKKDGEKGLDKKKRDKKGIVKGYKTAKADSAGDKRMLIGKDELGGLIVRYMKENTTEALQDDEISLEWLREAATKDTNFD